MKHTDQHELIESWKQEDLEPFIGWDFSYLDGRMVDANYPGPIPRERPL